MPSQINTDISELPLLQTFTFCHFFNAAARKNLDCEL